MENVSLWIQKEDLCSDREELSDELDSSSKSRLNKLIKRSNSHSSIPVNAIQSQISKVFFKGLFFRHGNGLDNRIPKHMVSVDEKYLRRCLELVHNSALKAAQWNTPMSLRGSTIESLSESLNSGKLFHGDFVFDCPVATEIGGVVMNTDDTGEEWSLGSVMESKSMINILNSALLRKFGDSERNENLNRMNFSDAKGLICYDFIDSSSSLSVSSSYNLDKETTPPAQKYGSIPFHKRLASTSSATSTSSDWISSTSALSQGMIQCTWKQGIPHFIFSADDQKEVYVANLRKVIDSTDRKALDYVYQFHLNKGDRKGREIADEDLPLVGKMNVSTSFTLCPNNNCRVMETEFTLFQNIEVYDNASEYSHPVKNKGLKKKVSKVFRTNPSSKHRTLSKFNGSGSGGVSESCLWDPYTHGGINLLETNVPPNFEMASIVVKDHLPCIKPPSIGGWGLKFLDKSGANKTASRSESCNQNNDDCSSSMSILVPAGLHGGPRTRNGGPSSLIDRWRSGGHCDCGGWDEGCPLTVLQKKSSKVEVLSHVDTKGECVSVDLVTQGSNDISPSLRMVNVHDGLYYIHFHTPLSALQAFSVSVAIIHMQSPTLRPKSVQELS